VNQSEYNNYFKCVICVRSWETISLNNKTRFYISDHLENNIVSVYISTFSCRSHLVTYSTFCGECWSLMIDWPIHRWPIHSCIKIW